MSEKTKNINPWIFVVLLTIIIYMITGLRIGLDYAPNDWLMKTLGALFLPAVEMTNTATLAAIKIFGGESLPSATINRSILMSLAGMAVILFVVPWMMVTGSRNDPETGDPVKSIRWFAAVPVVITAIIIGVGVSFVSTAVYYNSKASIDAGYERDMMRHELMNLSMNAASIVFLPQAAGGGEGLFTGFADEENGDVRNIRLSDLNRYSDELPFHFEIERSVSDSMIVIAVENESQSKRYRSEVTPYDESLFRLK